MQVRGLPRQIIRNGAVASRLLAAKTPNIEAERRRDAVARFRCAMADGLTAEQAARAVGAPRSTLYRWAKAPEPGSRRPKRLREPKWPPSLVEAVEALRADNPMWGKRKIAALLNREGQAVSVSKVGRILKRLMARGAVLPVPDPAAQARRPALPLRCPPALRQASGQGPKSPGARRTGPDRHPIRQCPARPGDQALHRLRPGRQMDDRPCRNRRLRQRRKGPSRKASRQRALQGQGNPGRRRIRVHGRLRGPLPRQTPRARRPAAQTARP